MTRTLTASVLALSLALTSLSATPALADRNKDINRFIAGAITLMIVSKALENNRRSGSVTSRNPGYPIYKPGKNHRRASKSLPYECYFNLRTERGNRGVFGKTCLREFLPKARRLPRVCEDTVRIRYGRRADIYDAKCLRKLGWIVEARR